MSAWSCSVCQDDGQACSKCGKGHENCTTCQTEKLNDVARAICDSEAFMWLMVGANHPDSHLELLRKIWREHYLPAGGGYGKRVCDV